MADKRPQPTNGGSMDQGTLALLRHKAPIPAGIHLPKPPSGKEVWEGLRPRLEKLTKVPFPALPASANLTADWELMFKAWFFETSPALSGATWSGDTATFNATSPYSIDIKNSPSMAEVRKSFWAAGGTRTKPFNSKFTFTGKGTGVEDHYTLVEWFLGSYSTMVKWNTKPTGAFEVDIEVRNKSGWFSGTRLPKSWQNRIKTVLGFDIDALVYDAPRGKVLDHKVGALLRNLENGYLPKLPSWARLPAIGVSSHIKKLGLTPHLPSFGGSFYQVYQIRDTWTSGK